MTTPAKRKRQKAVKREDVSPFERLAAWKLWVASPEGRALSKDAGLITPSDALCIGFSAGYRAGKDGR